MSPPQLHLIIPGLLWPSKALHNSTYDLDLPALSWLLGRGRSSWQPPLSLESRLCHTFGIENAELPAAALRLLGEGGNPGADIWLCADPVHLHVNKGRMNLSGDAPPATAEELQIIVATLSPYLGEIGPYRGEYRGGSAGRGYLRLNEMPKLLTVPPSAACGEGNLLPRGEDAPLWRRLSNEVQMLLHALPLNAQRECDGLPTLNSLWFWGAGTLPPRRSCGYDLIIGSDPLLVGLARWADRPRQTPPSRLADLLKMPVASALLLLDNLRAPMRGYDAMAWGAALNEIEQDWLQPLQRALLSGRLSGLRLTALGDEASLDLTLTRADLLRFWRRPKPLHTLVYPHNSSPT